MTEPLLLARQQTAPGESLWEKAPGWRNLVTAASLFTVLALVTPVLMPPSDDTPPQITAPHRPLSVATATRPLVPSPAVPVPVAAPILPAPALKTASPQPRPIAPERAHAAPASSACLLVMPPAPAGFGSGTVIGFEDHATSLARIQLTESRAGGPIDPAYIDNQRVTVRRMNGNYQVLLVPTTMHVQTGDRVRFQSGFRNMNLPCNYIPNLITADLGPVPSPPPADAQAPAPP